MKINGDINNRNSKISVSTLGLLSMNQGTAVASFGYDKLI